MKQNRKCPHSRTKGQRSKTTVLTTGALIPQEHGGALRNGGTNKGGPGRPPSEIRQRLRGSFDERIPILEKIADAEKASASDKARVMELMGKFGLGTEQTIDIHLTGFSDAKLTMHLLEKVVRETVEVSTADKIMNQFAAELRSAFA